MCSTMEYKKSRNPTAFSILREGGTIIFPTDMVFYGNKEDAMIEVSFVNEITIDKRFLLTTDGVNRAMIHLREYEDFLNT